MSQENNKRIAKNTLFLYFRMLLTMGVALYTSRIVLKILGVDNFGIYNVILGFVAMFSMLSSTFTSATQRFLAFELGRNNKDRARDVFSISLNIHFSLALVIVLIIETFGVWFLNHKLSIPAPRLGAANWVLQFSMLTFVINLMSIPYNAAIIANERMNIFAYITFLEVFLKLAVLFFLERTGFDKLIVYSVLMMGIAISIRSIYGIYCRSHFQECKYRKVQNKSIYKEVLGISGWNFLGSSASIFTVEGIGILLNLYGGGVVVNAAKGIAAQVQNAVQQLVGNFMISLNPQITKSYAANDQKYMISLVDRGSRFSFYLLSLVTLPILLETETLLRLWLNATPPYAMEFVRVVLLYLMIHPFSTLLDQVLLATGNIKNSQIFLSILQLMNIPVSFILLKLNYPPYYIYFGFISINIISLAARLIFTHNRTILTFRYYILKVLLRPFAVICVSLLGPFLILYTIHPSTVRFFFTSGTIFLLTSATVFAFGLDKQEKAFFRDKALSIFNKFRAKIP